MYKDGESDEEGKALPGDGRRGADEEEHEGGGEDVAEEEAKEECFGVALVDFRGWAWGGTGLDGRGTCSNEEEGVDGHGDAHGDELEDDADDGGDAEGEWRAIAGGFEEEDQSDDADDWEERGEEGTVG